MRVVPTVLAVLIAACPAFAQSPPKPTPKPAPAKPAPAKPAPAKPAPPANARAGYAAMTAAERMAIQSDLIWTGDYNGIIAPELNDRAIAAVKSFQKRWGGRDSGVLTPAERLTLAQEAKPKQDAAGWRLVDDSATGAWLGLPGKFVPRASSAAGGSHWQSARGEVQVDTFRRSGVTLAATIERLKKEPAARKVEYSIVRGDSAVLSGLQGLKKFYVRLQAKDNEVRGLTILYDQAMEGTMDAVTVAMSNAFVAFPGGTFVGVLPPGPPPKRKVDYGSGIVVSAAGHILTDRQLVDGCQSITVAGLGHAERLAEDKTADLALIKVNGASALTPAALGSSTMRADSATLIGIPDPHLQNGGREVATVTASLTPGGVGPRGIEPAPASGFSGAAALDAEARLIGMVGLKVLDAGAPTPRASLVPAATIRAFLYANSVAPQNGAAGLDAAKAAIVRVICVRR